MPRHRCDFGLTLIFVRAQRLESWPRISNSSFNEMENSALVKSSLRNNSIGLIYCSHLDVLMLLASKRGKVRDSKSDPKETSSRSMIACACG